MRRNQGRLSGSGSGWRGRPDAVGERWMDEHGCAPIYRRAAVEYGGQGTQKRVKKRVICRLKTRPEHGARFLILFYRMG
jgi:hypothetical protein